MAIYFEEKEEIMIYDLVFVVLVYRNTQDLEDFFESFNLVNAKVIVVNSYYDDNTEQIFKAIAKKNNADFISTSNNGYGAGNNLGCEHALNHYKFKYLVISNADIIIKEMKIEDLDENVITAPNIIDRNGKLQNPSSAYYDRLIEKLYYYIFKYKKYSLVYLCVFINKIEREIFYITHKIVNAKKIYQAHGANIIFPYNILEKLHPIFNEEMFLFCEEPHLAKKANSLGIPIEYNDKILVLHKEDGSTSFLDRKIMDITRDSYLVYYKYWHS